MAAIIAAAVGALGTLGAASMNSSRATPAAPAGRSEARSDTVTEYKSTFSNPVSPSNDGSIKSPFTQSFGNDWIVATSGSKASGNRTSSTLPPLTWWVIGGCALIALYLYRKKHA